jgi:SAM-dependent methyltransferase
MTGPDHEEIIVRTSARSDTTRRPASGRRDSVRRSYDAVAEKYADGFRDELAGKPLDRALLACLIEQTEQGAPIADVGCGPGHVSAWLARHGATAVGIDLSAGMVAVGRRAFHIGSEVRHLAQWWGHEVDIDFRFLEVPDVTATMERAGFFLQAQLERVNYPGEVETRRGYLLARRPS